MNTANPTRRSSARRSPSRMRGWDAASPPSPGRMLGGDAAWKPLEIPGFTQEMAERFLAQVRNYQVTPQIMFDYLRTEFYKQYQSNPYGAYYFWLFILVCANSTEFTPECRSFLAKTYAEAAQYFANTLTWRYGYMNGQLV